MNVKDEFSKKLIGENTIRLIFLCLKLKTCHESFLGDF